MKATIYCAAASMDVTYEEERYHIPLYHTDSGHLIAPTDNFDAEESAATKVSLHSSEALVQEYFEDKTADSLEKMYEEDWTLRQTLGAMSSGSGANRGAQLLISISLA